jgi:hypothetical protein
MLDTVKAACTVISWWQKGRTAMAVRTAEEGGSITAAAMGDDLTGKAPSFHWLGSMIVSQKHEKMASQVVGDRKALGARYRSRNPTYCGVNIYEPEFIFQVRKAWERIACEVFLRVRCEMCPTKLPARRQCSSEGPVKTGRRMRIDSLAIIHAEPMLPFLPHILKSRVLCTTVLLSATKWQRPYGRGRVGETTESR